MGVSAKEAKHRAKNNLGYIAGRYNKEIVDLVYSTYECSHPYLGKHPYNLTPEQVMQIGYNIGSKEEQKSLNN